MLPAGISGFGFETLVTGGGPEHKAEEMHLFPVQAPTHNSQVSSIREVSPLPLGMDLILQTPLLSTPWKE